MSVARIEQLMDLVLGAPPQLGVAAALAQRTHGDPRLVLVHLLVALGDGHPPVDALLGVLDTPPFSDNGRPHLEPEGDYWAVSYAGRTVRLRDARGLHYLAPLLRAPGRSIHVRELVAAGAIGPGTSVERARQAVTKAIKLVLDRLQACHPTLAEHLTATVERGYFCRYLPDTNHPSPNGYPRFSP